VEGQHFVNESQPQNGLGECPRALLPLLTKGGDIPPVAGQPRHGIVWVSDSYIYTKSFCMSQEILKATEHKTGEAAAAQGIEFRVLVGRVKGIRG